MEGLFFHIDINLSHHLLNWITLLWWSYQKLFDGIGVSLFLDYSFLWYVLSPIANTAWSLIIVLCSKSCSQNKSSNFFIFKNCFDYPRLFSLQIYFRINILISLNKCVGNFIVRTNILVAVCLSVYDNTVSFHLFGFSSSYNQCSLIFRIEVLFH